ncbi:hypothetical protein [Paraburkholderia sp. C35]|uniref:defense against restriction DarA-related protein n=1 Tax=Paraburkholderia sp. C35 TaxID=2126993 RepID=UPI000D694054|nr:hypothetical protein [Paraburkholderia sp. C35]
MDTFSHIEQAAHDSAYGHNTRPAPTIAQQDAGNYKKGRAAVADIPVVIENPRGSLREWRAADGTSGANLMKFHYGYVEGVTGADGDELDCYVGPYPEAQTAYVVNQNVRGAFDEHKVMLGFPDQRTAEAGYLSNFNAGWPGLESCVPCSIAQLRWWMTNGDMSIPLTQDQLPHEERNPMQKVLWDSANMPVGKTLAQVLYEIRSSDGSDGLIFDPVSIADILGDADGVVTLDALVIPFAKLPQRMEILRKVMDRKGDGISVLSVQVTEPFTQRGTTNVAAVFELSDGQTVSIFFHNPDVTPKKIMATDDVVSWKWMLNKKDITIVVAPEKGRDLNVQNVAARVMTLAGRNSSRFAETNTKRAERMENIAGLQKQYDDGVVTLENLNAEISELEIEVEQKRVLPVVAEPALAAVAVAVAVAEPEKTVAQTAIDNQDNATLDAIQAALDAQIDALSLDDLRRMATYEPTSINGGEKLDEYDLRAKLKQMHPDDIQTSLDYLAKYQESVANAEAEAAAAAAAQGQLALDAPDATAAANVTPDISYAPVDDMFTAFYPETPAGEEAWKNIAAHTDGTGKVLHTQVDDTIQQLRDAGYTVAERKPDTTVIDDDLLNALANDLQPDAQPDASESAQAAPEPEAPHKSELVIAALRELGWRESASPMIVQKNVGGAVPGELNEGGDRIVLAQFDDTARYLSLVLGFDQVFDVDTRDGDASEIAAAFDARTMEWAASTAFKPEPQVAEAAIAAPVEQATAPTVPDRLRKNVEFALETLRGIADGIEAAKSLEQRIGGNGRYQADALRNRQKDIDRAHEILADFRELAPKNGIDPEAFIASLGGEPDLTPSPEAAEWLKPTAESAAAPAVDPAAAALAAEADLDRAATEGYNAGLQGDTTPPDWVTNDEDTLQAAWIVGNKRGREEAAQAAADAAPLPGDAALTTDQPTGEESATTVETPAPATVTASPLSDETMQKYIAIAADSINALRRIDVYRVLYSLASDNEDGVTRSALATWIAQKRPDLAAEVTAVMAEEWPDDGWTLPAADPGAQVTDPLPEGITEVQPIEPEVNSERAADLAFLQTVTAQSIDMMADGVAERIDTTLGKYPGDADIEAAVRDAVNSYTDYMTKAIAG